MNGLVRWLFAPTRRLGQQIPRALAVSAVAAAVDVGLLVVFVELCRLSPLAAAVISYLAGGVVQYVLSSLWVFAHRPANHLTAFALFVLLSLVGLGITAGVVALLHGTWGLHYLTAKGVALGLSFCWNFTSRKYLIFNRTTELPPSDAATREVPR